MPEYEKDFLLRQSKLLAKGLGAFLSQESVDEIMSMEEAETSEKQEQDDNADSESPTTPSQKS